MEGSMEAHSIHNYWWWIIQSAWLYLRSFYYQRKTGNRKRPIDFFIQIVKNIMLGYYFK